MNKSGEINIIIGCMFSGKTTELIRECRRRLTINQKVLGINYSDDKRYTNEDYIVAHNLEKIKCIRAKYLKDIPDNDIKNVDKFVNALINTLTDDSEEGYYFKKIDNIDEVYFSDSD